MIRKLTCMLLAFVALACTNNGDIGYFYGVWALDSVKVDGVEDASINVEDFYWRFQNNILQINEKKPLHTYDIYTGTWEERDKELILDFTHYPSGDVPGKLHLQAGKKLNLAILTGNASAMTLKYISDEGATIIYTLRKLK